MKYMLLIYVDPNTVEDNVTPEYMALAQSLAESGELVAGDGLQGIDTATSVRVQAGDVTTTDGPFAETKEWLAGYFLVDCKDLDRAIQVAAKVPGARHGTVEVRPLKDLADG